VRPELGRGKRTGGIRQAGQHFGPECALGNGRGCRRRRGSTRVSPLRFLRTARWR
jgi:hypothetical protein